MGITGRRRKFITCLNNQAATAAAKTAPRPEQLHTHLLAMVVCQLAPCRHTHRHHTHQLQLKLPLPDHRRCHHLIPAWSRQKNVSATIRTMTITRRRHSNPGQSPLSTIIYWMSVHSTDGIDVAPVIVRQRGNSAISGCAKCKTMRMHSRQ